MKIFLYSISEGLGVYMVQLAQGLARKDTVAIALSSTDAAELNTAFPSFFQKAQFRVISVPHFGGPDPRKVIEACRTFLEIIRHGTEVLHVTLGGLLTEAYPVLWLIHKMGIPMVATVHDPWFHPGDLPFLRSAWITTRVLGWCSQIIVHGQSLAEEMIERMGVDERVLNIVPHGNYDIYLHTVRSSLPEEATPGRVLMFGRMRQYKGLDVLIEAAPLIAEAVPGLKILMAGKGDVLNCVPDTVKAGRHFEVRNEWIPADEVPVLFASSSVVVIPYVEASQSGVLHLAYTCGRPVVAARVGAIPESLTHGREGYLVPPGDPKALAQAVIEILRNRELAARMGRNARRKAETELDWGGAIAEKTRQVFEKAIAMKKSHTSYPGVGTAERWRRVREGYWQQLNHERNR